jgi:hypothetical protein
VSNPNHQRTPFGRRSSWSRVQVFQEPLIHENRATIRKFSIGLYSHELKSRRLRLRH